MNCLVCGHKLAIFRKLSLGDFCSQEHRSLFAKDQSDRGLERLMATHGEPAEARTRVFAQFLHEELPASVNGDDWRSPEPLSRAQMMGPDTRQRPFTRLAPAQML